jgi:hypothetical protein
LTRLFSGGAIATQCALPQLIERKASALVDLRDMRIGYVPCSESLELPGDRRRFCYYARKRNLVFEIARPTETYDVAVVTAVGDISVWRNYRRGNAKIVYDQVDAYLATPALTIKGIFRGVAKFAVRQNRHLLLNYSTGIKEMCHRADAVICSTVEQERDIHPYCRNVHVILDFQGSSIRSSKKDYSAGEVFSFVWEGLPGNMRFLSEIRNVLLELLRKRKIAIHVITDLRYGKYLNGQFGQRRTEEEAAKIFDRIHLYAWNEQTFSAISTACDLALIPIPLQDPVCAGKPENKLLFFWRLGMPAIVSATPAHTRVMQQCGLPMACQTAQDWRATLDRYVFDEQARREAGQRGKAFAERHHGEERMLAQWDEVFHSILGKPSDQAKSNCHPCETTERLLESSR